MSNRIQRDSARARLTDFAQWPGWRHLLPAQSSADLNRQETLLLQTSVLTCRVNIFLGLFAAACIAALMAYWNQEQSRPFLWFTLIACGLFPGAWMSAARNWQPGASGKIRGSPLALILNALYCSTIWGASAWFLLPAGSPEAETIFVSTMVMILAGSGSGIVYRPLMLALVIPLTVIFSLGLWRLGNFHQFLAFAFLVAGGATAWFCKTNGDAARLAVRLKFEVERLLDVSTQQREIADIARAQAESARGQAELANRGKTAFLAAAGHDLRQPMHALVQYHADLWRRNADPALNGTLMRVGKSLDAMQDLLDSMLEVSRLLTGSVRPVIRRFAAADLIDELDAQLRPLAENKGLGFIAIADKACVETDSVLLERIVRNLTINAIRYTHTGRVVIRCKRRGEWLRVQVWDTGIGIHKVEQEKIFQEFYQVGNDARDARKGLGLGLALVRQLCDLLELKLRMRSTPGRGSVFMVDVPIAQGMEPTVPTNSDGAVADYVRGAFMVLIDDNEASLDGTAETLRACGARVLTASSGLEAIERLQNQEFMPQLVISDYRLEHGETGLDAIRTVIDNQRALFGDEFEISTLVLSGDTAPQELHAVQAAGHVMLHKPLRPAALYEAVNAQLAALARSGIRV